MRRILPIISICLVLPAISARSSDENGDSEDRFSTKSDEPAADAVESSANEEHGLGEFSSYPQREDTRGDLEPIGLSDFYRDPTDQYRYMVKIKIDELLWPGSKPGFTSPDNNMILIGVPRPRYRLKGNPYIRGKMDLRIGGSLFGMENAGLFTLGYDFRSNGLIGKVSSSFRFDKISYKLTMHFDGP